MSNIFDALENPEGRFIKSMTDGTAWSPSERLNTFTAQFGELSNLTELLFRSASSHFDRIASTHGARTQKTLEHMSATSRTISDGLQKNAMLDDWTSYLQDMGERMILSVDTLRKRGDNFLEHEGAGCPPVLSYDYDVIIDGRNLNHPCNYQLLQIKPPEGFVVEEDKRPYIIIDPRAGHGAGIGGFKPDSQVGVALRDGRPVYFVSFTREPVPGQTLADVTRAEAIFVRTVMKRHPASPNPVVVGNCQGGWAALILAALNPDLTGPIVLNGAPVDSWAGVVGDNPMRYNAGVLGGAWQPMMWADVGHGVFDGAHLVTNFELLNPSRNYFRKYYDLYAAVDTEEERFLEFEKWWGGFFLLNEAEIRWIVEQLFVGNRLTRNEARLESGRPIDVKLVRAPIIVFASHGDNITPPQQALNWILKTYTDVQEIRIRGQRIIYMVHEQVGHLGIFVSAKIAKREHTEMASVMKTIEALAPGLYEMTIEDYEGDETNRTFTVSFNERRMEDLAKLDDGFQDEACFSAVARHSELQSELYDIFMRPLVQLGVTENSAEMLRITHPLRMQRALMSTRNPIMHPVSKMAEHVRTKRSKEKHAPLSKSTNPFVQMEQIWADLFEQSIDIVRDLRDAAYEMSFFTLWGTPYARWFGRNHLSGRILKRKEELRALPEVRAALMHIDQGDFTHAVIRMLILLAESRGSVRRDRLERSSQVLTKDEPFASLTADQRIAILHEQTLIAQFEKYKAIKTLPKLLKSREDRELAIKVAQFVPGAMSEMAPSTLEILQTFCEVLGLPPVTEDVLQDPLTPAKAEKAAKPARKPRSAPARARKPRTTTARNKLH